MFSKKKILLATTLLSYSLFAHAGFEAEPNNSITTATPMRLNEIFTGNTDAGQLGYDYFKLELTTPTEIKFHFKIIDTAVSHGAIFRILTSNGSTFYSITISQTNFDHIFPVNLVAGSFYIQVFNASYSIPASPYELSAQSPLSVPRLVTIPSVIDTASLPDVNGNGYEDFAILRILSDARTAVLVVDGETQKSIRRIIFTSDSRVSQPISITGFNDVDNNGTPDIGVLFYDSTQSVNSHIIREATTGRLVKSFKENASQ